ncbi:MULTISPECIES: helix-turn-helix domain-containing protein [Novosphingobium]|uniref:Helix-turn-helix domain-containing protein n=1 Tax=Novosphingobium mangrovi (ex Hu et al. 2023) TaxID=2930094 RepID=A0ABT0ACK1_9SPHN|nr:MULTISPECIES: helix-turn-helix domain-containing protein [Novosphingobium]MCJ1960920.1 helix-turn-helix domain-containing protein [Novosphingobium mangrovi (ex Hu et al. 2023)]
MTADSSIRVIGRALEILRVINLKGSPSLSEIQRSVDLPYPTVLRLVRALVEEGVVEREPSRKRYRPTPLVQALSYGFQGHDALVTAARPHIEALTGIVHWPISVVTRMGNMMVVRDSTSTQTPLTFNHYYPGWQVPLIQSASGRAYLAHATPDSRASLIRHVEATGSEGDVQMLRVFENSGEAEKIRKQGYVAISRTAYSANPGRTSSFAVPIFEGEKLLGALTLVFFATAMTVEDALAKYLDPVLQTARRIGEDMGRSVPAGTA